MLFPVNQGTGVVVAAGSTGLVDSSPGVGDETAGMEEVGDCNEQAIVNSNARNGKNRTMNLKRILLKYVIGMIDWGGRENLPPQGFGTHKGNEKFTPIYFLSVLRAV